jgi:hypothetical protein
MMSISGSVAERETHDIKNTVSSGPASVIFGRVDARYSGWLSLPTDRTC